MEERALGVQNSRLRLMELGLIAAVGTTDTAIRPAVSKFVIAQIREVDAGSYKASAQLETVLERLQACKTIAEAIDGTVYAALLSPAHSLQSLTTLNDYLVNFKAKLQRLSR